MSHALSVSATSNNCIIDYGATCHVCNDKKLFTNSQSLDKPQKVRWARVKGNCKRRCFLLEMKLPGGKTSWLMCRTFLLSYSVSKATESGKTTKFDETGYQILGKDCKVIAAATHVGSLYYLDCLVKEQVNVLIDANLPHKFWAEALSTVVYLKNHGPTIYGAVKDMTPFETWKNTRPKAWTFMCFWM